MAAESYVTREETVTAIMFYRNTMWDVYALNGARDATFEYRNGVLSAKLTQADGSVIGVKDKDYVVCRADKTIEAMDEQTFFAKYKKKEA